MNKLDDDWNPLIADFGLSKQISGRISRSVAISAQKFTINWTPPEGFEIDTLSVKSDVYSFAMVMYEIVTTTIPWYGRSIAYITEQVTNGNSGCCDENQLMWVIREETTHP